MTEKKNLGGRPKGSKNRAFTQKQIAEARRVIDKAMQGEEVTAKQLRAAEIVIRFCFPQLRAVLPQGCAELELIECKVKEYTDFEKRIEALEQKQAGKDKQEAQPNERFIM